MFNVANARIGIPFIATSLRFCRIQKLTHVVFPFAFYKSDAPKLGFQTITVDRLRANSYLPFVPGSPNQEIGLEVATIFSNGSMTSRRMFCSARYLQCVPLKHSDAAVYRCTMSRGFDSRNELSQCERFHSSPC